MIRTKYQKNNTSCWQFEALITFRKTMFFFFPFLRHIRFVDIFHKKILSLFISNPESSISRFQNNVILYLTLFFSELK